jgi:hypothetical protein
MTARAHEAYASPQLAFGVTLEERKQLVLPGTRAPVLLQCWTWGPHVASECPRCRCTPDAPCTVVLEGECGEAACVPAGAYGHETCSRCLHA